MRVSAVLLLVAMACGGGTVTSGEQGGSEQGGGSEAPNVVGTEGVELPTGTPAEHAYEAIVFEGPRATDEERVRCEEAGGTVRPAGMMGADHCIQSLADAGQPCQDASDCLGRCVAPMGPDAPAPGAAVTGTCEETDEVFGCTATVEGGVMQPAICID